MIDVGELLSGLIGHEGIAAAEGSGALEAVELITVDEDGWPHVAWLSAGELVATGPSTIAACLWPSSRTRANLRREGQGLLQAVVRGEVVKLRVRARELRQIVAEGLELTAFVLEVQAHEQDAVGYAEVLGGPRYRLHRDPDAVLTRWRTQLRALTDLTGSDPT